MAKRVNKAYLTPNQVAELLMVSPTAVRQWAEKGDLNALTTPGGHRRFLPEEVNRFAREKGMNLSLDDNAALRVLIVDDDVELATFLDNLLKGFSGQVETEVANDGFIAGLKIREFKPNVLLLDLMMPGVNGFEVCAHLKSDALTMGTRVIAMTGHPSEENLEKIKAAGAESCLHKPFRRKELLDLLGLQKPAKA